MTGEHGRGPAGVEEDLGLLSAGVRALRDLALDPVASEDAARVYDFGVRWGVLISGRLERLEHYHRAGELTREQEGGYRKLRRELEDATPLAEGLGLGRPTVPLED